MPSEPPDLDLERRALALFGAALEVAPEALERWLEGACAGDPRLAARLRALLAADAADAGGLPGLADGPAATAAEAPAGPPSQVGPYRLAELIGAGGMGSVYLAHRCDGLFDQTVAVKFVRPLQGLPNPGPLIEAERQLLARMEHPGIARILDGGTTAGGRHYLVMEFVRGAPLDEFVREHGLDRRARVALLREVCAGVAHAHQNLVLHCDIKPSNILVTAERHAKLIDFGVARLQGVVDASRPDGYTRAYTSPQRLAGAPATIADDVYSLGTVMHELLAEVAPDAELAAIATRATAIDPERRYASVAALDADLAAWLEQRPVAAVGGHWRYRARKLVARHPWGSAAALSAVIGLVLAVAVTSVLYARAEAARLDSERRFADVRRLASFMLFDLYDRLDGLPRSVAIRRDVAATSQQYLSRLAADAAAPVELQIETLEGLVRLAAVQASSTGGQLGLQADARANLASADRVAARLQARGLAVARLAHLRARILLQQAHIAADVANDMPTAQAQLAQARQQLDLALAGTPHDADLAETDADWYAAAAGVESWLGRYPHAGELARTAAQRLAALPPARRDSRAGRLREASIDDRIAEALYYSGDAPGAERPYEAELALLERAAAAFRGDATIARYRARAQWALGTTYLDNRRVAEALPLTRAALAGASELSAEDPDDREAAHLAAAAEFAYAQSLAAAHRTDEAIRTFRDIVERRAGAAAAQPQSPTAAREYATALFALADIYADRRRPADACPLYARGFETFAALEGRGGLTPLDRDYTLAAARARRAVLGCR